MRRSRFATLILLLVAAGPGELGAQDVYFFRQQTAPGCARIGAAFRELGGELVVIDVTPGAPAAVTGLRPGDRVRVIDGVSASLSRLDTLARALHPGRVVRFVVQRGEQGRSVDIVAAPTLCVPQAPSLDYRADLLASMAQFEERLDQTQRTLIVRIDTARLREETARARLERVALGQDDGAPVTFHAGSAFELGARSVARMEPAELNPDLARYFPGAESGILVLRVAPETPGARSGLTPGDVVVRVSGESVRTIPGLRFAIARAQGAPVEVEVVRNGKPLRLRLP
jgi:predicted metalloprotease with PDZ domain